METRTGTLTIPRSQGSGPGTDRVFFNFTSPVRQAVAILTGTSFGFSARDDHHLGLVNARLSTSIDDDVVTVEGALGVRDWSGEWDDNYEGTLQFVLLAELETGFLPSNLSLTGIEHNQVTQFFRSVLDPATARPDNFIGMIGEKNTVLRVFVDTQNDPTRPTIASVSGTLEVRPKDVGSWSSIAPLNGPIPPIKDGSINRKNANDTLNFLIPGAFSTGDLDYRVRAFDAAHPNQSGFTSGQEQGTLHFTSVQPLRVRGVGVHFTGTPEVAAPSVAQLRSTLAFVLKNYPVGRVEITGFDVIDYGGNFSDSSGGGCGPGWNGLLDRLREMQGDSQDIYYGLLASGTPTGSVIGCGGGDGRVAAGFVGDGPTAAQEIGHAFGRDHAPCGNPGNPDTNYPTYDAYQMGSIGEFGIDDLGNVQDPATVTDFMSYCGPNWISPYTFDALKSRFPAVAQSPRKKSWPTQPEHVPARDQHLFLSFRIYRNRKVKIFPSFHYESQPSEEPGKRTPYVIELRDRYDNVLQAHRVTLRDPHRDLDSASLDFYKPIPFPEETARVVVTCDADDCEETELLAVEVPSKPPKVRFVAPKGKTKLSGKVRVAWEAKEEDRQLSYLLRYSNDDGGTWQAVAPRMTEREHAVDLDGLPGGPACRFQVLATEGIRTGMAISDPFEVPERGGEATIDPPSGGTDFTVGDHVVLTGEVFSAHRGSAPPSELEWHSDLDGSLGAGHYVDLSVLRPGDHTITLRGPDGFGGETVATMLVRVRPTSSEKHTSRSQGDHSQRDHDSGAVPGNERGE